MCREEELAASFLLADLWDDALGNKTIVEIILGLVNDKRSIRLKEQKEKHRGGLLSSREVLQRLPNRGALIRPDVQLDRGCWRQFQFLQLEEYLGLRLDEPFCLGARESIVLFQRCASTPPSVGEPE